MVARVIKRILPYNFKNLFVRNSKPKIYIYPNLHGIGLGLFVFLCFLISVFYENNSGLLISIIIFFIFFISIFISHQNINNLSVNFLNEYLLEAESNNFIKFNIINNSNERKLNIDIDFEDRNLINLNFDNRVTSQSIGYQKSTRGIYLLGKITLKSIYPFGIIRTKINYPQKTKLFFYPQALKPTEDLLQKFEINISNKHDEFDGIDDYKKGDSGSKIAWKKSTIKDKKYVKTFNTLENSKLIILDLNAYKHLDFEILLNYSVYILNYFFRNKKNLTFKHNDKIISLTENKESLDQILKYLSDVKK